MPGSPHFISLEQAVAMTQKFRADKESILIPELRNKAILPICETFDRAAFETLLAKTGCASLRVYLGMDENQEIRVIAVAVNSAGEDILPAGAGNLSLTETEDIVEDGIRCPTNCPPSSPLNEDEP